MLRLFRALQRPLSKTEAVLSDRGFRLTFLALYVCVNVLLFSDGAVHEFPRHSDYRRWTTGIARGAGATLNLNSALVVLLAARSFITFLRETPLNLILEFDKAMPVFHAAVGTLVVVGGAVHAGFHWVAYAISSPWSGGLAGYTSLFVSGMLLVILLAVIRLTSMASVRMANFELFHAVHIGGMCLFYILLIVHGFHYGTPRTWKWVVAPLLLYTFDRLTRRWREHRSYVLVTKHAADFSDSDVLRLRLPRVFHFQAGQYAEVKVPALSKLQWHPFTIASSPHEEGMTFYIKSAGDWSAAMHAVFRDRVIACGEDIEVHVRGPYGSPAQHVGQFEHIVLIGGGVGATPFSSVTKAAHHWMTNWGAPSSSLGATAAAAAAVAPAGSKSTTTRRYSPGDAVSSGDRWWSQDHESDGKGELARGGGTHPLVSGAGSGMELPPIFGAIAKRPAVSFAPTTERATYVPSSVIGADADDDEDRSIASSGTFFTAQDGRDSNECGLDSGSERGAPVVGPLDAVIRVDTDDNSSSDGKEAAGGLTRWPTGRPRRGPGIPTALPSGSSHSSGSDVLLAQEGFATPLPSATLPAAADGIPRGPLLRSVSAPSISRPSADSGRPPSSSVILDMDAAPPPSPFFGRHGDGGRGSSAHALATQPPPYAFSQDVLSVNQTASDMEHRRRLEQRVAIEKAAAAGARGSDGGSQAYIEALTQAFSGLQAQERTATYHMSVSAMIGMSFGSTAMVRHAQQRRARLADGTLVDHPADDLAVLRSKRMLLLLYLHSVTVNILLLWVLLARFVVVGFSAIFGELDILSQGLSVHRLDALTAVDLVLCGCVMVVIGLTSVLEVIELRGVPYNGLDLFVLFPASLFCVVTDILSLAGVRSPANLFGVFQLLIVWPVLALFLGARLLRVIGDRVVLAENYQNSHSKTRSLDFVWTAPSPEADSWLVREMLPLADSPCVRLHRYLTRSAPALEPWMADYERVPLRTHYGRPDWDGIFAGIAARSRNNAVHGVFFCGPAAMADAVRAAAMRAMRGTIVRGLLTGAGSATFPGARGMNVFGQEVSAAVADLSGAAGLEGSLGGGGTARPGLGGASSSAAETSLDFGCNVKFVVRVEHFG
ncbi:hypothetical protein MMPV_000675 [Pyropia vietnamensis]